MMCDELVE